MKYVAELQFSKFREWMNLGLQIEVPHQKGYVDSIIQDESSNFHAQQSLPWV